MMVKAFGASGGWSWTRLVYGWCTRINGSVDCAGVEWPESGRLLAAAAAPVTTCQRDWNVQHGVRSVTSICGPRNTRVKQCRLGLHGGIPLTHY